jgi:hypothetical protein
MGPKLSHWAVLASSALAAAVGCSLYNREGPDDTCQNLLWGAINACKEGIIATCRNGAMGWNVCDSKDACEASWQTLGAYRCAESDPLPLLEAGGAGGGAGQAGSSGNGSVGADCSSNCVLATVGGSAQIDELAVDSSGVYYSDCSNLYRVTVGGGVPALLHSGLADCTYSPIVLTDSFAYVDGGDPSFIEARRVIEASKGGGASRVAISSQFGIAGFWVTEDQLLWYNNTTEVLYATPLVGGLDSPVVTSINWIPRFVQLGTDLYVADVAGDIPLSRIDLSVSYPTTAVAINTAIATRAVRTDGVSLYLSDGASEISKFEPDTGVETNLVGGLNALVDYAVQGGWVWFIGRSAQGTAIMRVPSSGGTVQTVVEVGDSAANIQVDESAVYWSDGQKVMKRSWQ